MAKEEKGKIKIRFFEVDLEGTDETLQEVIRTVTTIAGRAPTVLRTKALPSSPKSQELLEPLSEDGSNVVDLDEIQEEIPMSSTKPKKKRSYANPQVVEIDLKSGDMPFANYCKSKNPSNTVKKYIVCAAWLKEFRGEDEISINHIYTCFRVMSWGVQRDMGQPFRSGKKLGYFDNGSKNGLWKINHIGLDKADKMGSA
jgi:hypothetical protein